MLQVLLMQPNTTAVFSFQMSQAAIYYGGVGTCNFNTTVNYAVRCLYNLSVSIVLGHLCFSNVSGLACGNIAVPSELCVEHC